MDDEGVMGLVLRYLRPGGEVLDVGCGDGRILELLAAKGVRGLGVDPWPRGGSVPCVRLRAEEIGSLGRKFALIYTFHSLHHFADPQRFIHEARAALEPGGILLIVDWIAGAHTGVRERYFRPEEVKGWLMAAGFELIEEGTKGQSMILVARSPLIRRGKADGISPTLPGGGRG